MKQILSEITDEQKPEWKEFCKKYEKVVSKEVRKRLGFWKYYFTSQGIEGEFIMLNSAWTDMKKTSQNRRKEKSK